MPEVTTMRVTVMFRNNWFGGDGWTYYPVTIEIADTCPKCGGKRGEPRPYRFCEDGEWISVSRWENACGHIDRYPEVLIESGYVGSEAAAAYRKREETLHA